MTARMCGSSGLTFYGRWVEIHSLSRRCVVDACVCIGESLVPESTHEVETDEGRSDGSWQGDWTTQASRHTATAVQLPPASPQVHYCYGQQTYTPYMTRHSRPIQGGPKKLTPLFISRYTSIIFAIFVYLRITFIKPDVILRLPIFKKFCFFNMRINCNLDNERCFTYNLRVEKRWGSKRWLSKCFFFKNLNKWANLSCK